MNRLLPSWLEWFDAGSELIILLNGEEEAQESQRKGSRIHWPEQVHALATTLVRARDSRRTSR